MAMPNHAQDKKIAALEKRRQALELAKAGIDYQTIADRIGYNSRQAAWKAVNSAIKDIIRPPAEAVRDMQIARLDSMLASIWASVKQGQYGAIDRALKLEERRAKLLGLDAPVKTDLTNGGEITLTVKYQDKKPDES